MTYGFRLQTTEGITVIDENYKNYMVHSKGRGPATGTGIVDVSIPAIAGVLLFARVTSTYEWDWTDILMDAFLSSATESALVTGGTVRLSKSFSDSITDVSAALNSYIEWVVLIPFQNNLKNDHGLQVFNKNGEVVFHSGYEQMQLAGRGIISVNNNAHPSFTLQNSTRKRYMCMSGHVPIVGYTRIYDEWVGELQEYFIHFQYSMRNNYTFGAFIYVDSPQGGSNGSDWQFYVRPRDFIVPIMEL